MFLNLTGERQRAPAYLSGILCLVLSACGGGGGGDGGGGTPTPTPDTTAPTATITAPADGSSTSASSVTVTGTAADNVAVASVSVNGVAATGTTSWTASVPLTVGANTITVSVTDSSNNTNANAASVSVTRTVETQKPTAVITFPPSETSATTGATVTVAGTASDVGSSVSAVSVNGIAATSTDGFATWRATVPLATGANTLTVSVTDTVGNTEASAASVAMERTTPFLQRPWAIHPGGQYIADHAGQSIFEVDWTTGATSIVTSAAVGTGPRPGTMVGVNQTLDPTKIIALDQSNDRLLRIDVSTGDRTTISDATTGSGPAFVAPIAMRSNLASDLVYVVDQDPLASSESRVLTVNLTTGARTVLSGARDGVGTGPALPQITDLARDGSTRLVMTAQFPVPTLYLVDLATGNRTQRVGSTPGVPATGYLAHGLSFGFASNTVYVVTSRVGVVNSLAENIFAVDLTTNAWTALTMPAGSLPEVGLLKSIGYHPATDEMLVVDRGGGRVIGLGVPVGTTVPTVRVVAGEQARVGTGHRPVLSSGLSRDATTGALYTGEYTGGGIYRFESGTGDRTLVSPSPIGCCDLAAFADTERNRLLAMDDSDSLYAIDPTTGVRTTITAAATGSGGQITVAAFDAARDRVLVKALFGSIAAVDVVTGASTTFATVAGTPALVNPAAMEVDAANDRLLVADKGNGNIIRFDLASGARTLLHTVSASVSLEAIAGDAEQLFYVDSAANTVHRVDLASGADTVIHDSATHQVAGLALDAELEWDPVDRVLYMLDIGSHALTAIDPVSGDRVIISR